jgi:hypothetical protein
MRKLAKSANLDETNDIFSVEFHDGTCEKISYAKALEDPIVVVSLERYNNTKEQHNDALEQYNFKKAIKIKTGEEALIEKMVEGWNIGIECKGKGRGYGMSYEANAYMVGDSIIDRMHNMRHAVGDNLLELIYNLFEGYDIKKEQWTQTKIGESNEEIF